MPKKKLNMSAAKAAAAKAAKERRTANYTVTIAAPVVRGVALQTTVAATSRKEAGESAIEEFKINGEYGFTEVEHDDLNPEAYTDQDDTPHVLATSLDSTSGQVLECDDCAEEFLPVDIKPLEEIKDLLMRIEPGDRLPHGECPDCGAFVYDRDKGRD